MINELDEIRKEILIEKFRTESDYYYNSIAESQRNTDRQYGKLLGLEYSLGLLNELASTVGGKDIAEMLEDEKVQKVHAARTNTYEQLLASQKQDS